ncbi:type II toxin -antitoxin system TacA 1-like antitoxin [Porticoccus sp. GXU_MW_L64]
MRLSIEITPEQHQRLKATAALQGKSIKEYVLERTLPAANDDMALRDLETFLKPRLDTARQGNWSDQSASEIFDSVKERMK